tara:strand:- start:868 stop:1041 length:174 start_codon:yes stop_codon:yes gene_type:complete
MSPDLGWLFLYLAAFGLSDFFAGSILKVDSYKMIYYAMLLSIGVIIMHIHYKDKNKK